MNKTFHQYELPAMLLRTLAKMNYHTPTLIQNQVIPRVLKGQDILASSRTGSGKTAAFSVPIVAQLMQSSKGRVLILAPTRELAKQIEGILATMVYGSTLRTALLIGGEPIEKQLIHLRLKPEIIVGVPGRILDHLSRGSLSFRHITCFVLDEIDCMLNIGFALQLEKIIKHLPIERQTLMFSATLDKTIEQLAQVYLRNPVRINVEPSDDHKPIKEEFLYVKESEKFSILLQQLDKRQGSVIIFTKTQVKAENINYQLRKANFNVKALHGGLNQHKRQRIMDGFRNKRYTIMVATDLAARGLDVDHIRHVINYDFPQAAEDYIHRIGRTGRAGRTGFAFSMISSPNEKKLWSKIQNKTTTDSIPYKKRPYKSFKQS